MKIVLKPYNPISQKLQWTLDKKCLMCGERGIATWSHPELFAHYPKLNNLFKRWRVIEVKLCRKDYKEVRSIRQPLQDWEDII